MIHLTRLNGNPIVVNSELIKFADSSPDTMLTLVNGEKLIVREGLCEVTDLVLQYRARLLAEVARQLPERVAAVACIGSAQSDAIEKAEATDGNECR